MFCTNNVFVKTNSFGVLFPSSSNNVILKGVIRKWLYTDTKKLFKENISRYVGPSLGDPLKYPY